MSPQHRDEDGKAKWYVPPDGNAHSDEILAFVPGVFAVEPNVLCNGAGHCSRSYRSASCTSSPLGCVAHKGDGVGSVAGFVLDDPRVVQEELGNYLFSSDGGDRICVGCMLRNRWMSKYI